MPDPIYLSGFAFSVGSPLPIELLLKDGVLSADSYDDCIGRGITTFCARECPMETMTTAAADAALSMQALAPGDVSRVVLKDPDCAAFAAGVEMAAARIAAGTAQHVLLVLEGHVPIGSSRYSPELGTVFGEGAAACIVSSRRGGFEALVVASALRGDPLQPAASAGEQMLQDFQTLRNLLRTSYERASISPADVSYLFGTHGSQIYLELMAEAAGVPCERAYSSALRAFGHVLACDNIVALAHFLQHSATRCERIFCVIGWSPRSAGVVLLKELA